MSDPLDNKKNFIISQAPHLWRGFSVNKIMYLVVIALLFPTFAAIWLFGYYAIMIIVVSIGSAVLTEFIIKKLRKKRFIMDGSAVITGLLLALTLPPTIQLWMVIIGSAFSIAIVKEAFGGLGYNIFNPALGGRAFLSVSFPRQMTTWILPAHFDLDAIISPTPFIDALTGATPLSDAFVPPVDKLSLYKDLFYGYTAGSLGETSALLILIGAILLLSFKIIEWRIPVFYLGTVALGSFLIGKDVIFQLLTGGLMIGAFFMATDYATSPVTKNGKIIFAVGAGTLTFVLRNYSGMPEGVTFAILIMNAFTPLIDKYIKIKPYGFRKKV